MYIRGSAHARPIDCSQDEHPAAQQDVHHCAGIPAANSAIFKSNWPDLSFHYLCKFCIG